MAKAMLDVLCINPCDWRFRLLAVLLFGFCLNSCSDNLSKSRIESMLKSTLLGRDNVQYCMNKIKLKKYRSNDLFDDISENDFPIVFSEEAFVKWNEIDKFITKLLLVDSLIEIHQGGYEQSVGVRGRPGQLFVVDSDDKADTMFEEIRTHGALVDLTKKGREVHAWRDNNFCVTGSWTLDSLTDWTEPAADSNGRVI
jgi:hypothetical protein